jgi:hypothetical protein
MIRPTPRADPCQGDRTPAFKAAAVVAASVSFLGDAAGHVHRVLPAGNFAPGNAGVLFFTDAICPRRALSLLIATHRQQVGQT